MIHGLLIGAALAGKWDGQDADVVATRTLPVSAEAAFAVVSDPAKLMALFPADCAVWKVPLTGEVPDATGIVTYKAALMVRKLDVMVKQADPAARLVLDHAGPKGFSTVFTFAPEGGGTLVTLKTPLLAPPKPLVGYYFKQVKPDWEGCHARTLEALEAAAKAP